MGVDDAQHLQAMPAPPGDGVSLGDDASTHLEGAQRGG